MRVQVKLEILNYFYSMENVQLQVEGMDCANCALTIRQYLQKQSFENIKVNHINGRVEFDAATADAVSTVSAGLQSLGYKVVPTTQKPASKTFLRSTGFKLLLCCFFVWPFFLHMIPGLHMHWFMGNAVQFAFATPIFLVGLFYFGKSALYSLWKGVPNMDVLVTLGATAAYGYSLYGWLVAHSTDFLFFETTATIITLVFVGNYLEERAIAKTQTALQSLTIEASLPATMIAFDGNYSEQLFTVDAGTLRSGDLLLINAGETVPADSKIIWGEAWVNESIITGESLPVHKTQNDFVIGGSTLTNGTVKAYVQKAATEGVLSNIKKMVEDAQTSKPPVQLLADKISAVFVPTVVAIAVVCFLVNYALFDVPITQSFLRAVAVLVIACPCAMGLATPAAVAVGLGRAATNGILFKNASTLELFKDINCVVFDKTGTLTTGDFVITKHAVEQPIENWQQYVYALEKHSTHPLATCLQKAYKSNVYIKWKQIEEVKGWGVKGTDDKGVEWKIGSHKWLGKDAPQQPHSVYLWRNNEVVAWWDLADEVRPETKQVIDNLHAQQVKTVLLSGDSTAKCAQVAQALGIQEFWAEQTPASKLAFMEKLAENYTVAMVGDGINDAPALAKASVGISLGNATQLAILSSQVVLMKNNLAQLPQALWLGRHTYKTIQTNFMWALGYNIVAIPIAAFGFLSPTIGALVMGFSDVILVLNSILLKFKRMP